MTGTTLEAFRTSIKSRLNKMNEASAVSTGAVSDPTPLSQSEIDFGAWRNDYRKWQKVKELITFEVLAGTETQVVALKNQVVTGFKAAYIDLI